MLLVIGQIADNIAVGRRTSVQSGRCSYWIVANGCTRRWLQLHNQTCFMNTLRFVYQQPVS